MTGLIVAILLAQTSAPHVRPKPKAPATPVKPAPPPPLCDGDYADALPAEKANAILDGARETFVFAIRNTATYEHVYYGREGKLRRAYLRSVVHGTGFGWRVVNGETQIVTNEHVASQPEVTDEDHTVEGVPVGSKKVREQLKIVRDENDDYEPGHIPLLKVLSDPQADIAVLKAKKVMPVMPWRVGRSSSLRSGNLVYVRGFPLGAFAAMNMGKVLNPNMIDSERNWNHVDFVVDALLNSGNSGSPVFAISCRSAEPELVGVYHAGYTDAAALNAVVGIDQLRDELDTLHVPRRDPAGLHSEITAADHDRLVKQLFTEPTRSITFPFAGRAVVATLIDPQTLRFGVLDDDFPLAVKESMALVDHGHNGFGTLDAIAVSVDGVPSEAPAQALDQDVREHFDRLYEALWRQVLGVIDYRARSAKGRLSADAFADAQAARTQLKKRFSEQKELLNICSFEADRANFGAARTASTVQTAPDVAAASTAAP
ncbi:MAG TPA: serine protease [Myxococcales bacterium]|nr:serine protease [Myxococcales bacterium]